LLFGSLAIDWIIECAVAFGPQRPQWRCPGCI